MIHETVIIHKSAEIAKDVDIGPYTVIGENSLIKSGTKIGSNTLIENSEIGEDCQISNHASIGTIPQDLKFKGELTKLFIGPNCKIREFVTLNRGTSASGKTVIGSNCLFMAYSHVAHDCIIGNDVILANAATLGGHVEISDNAVLGGLAGVHQFCRIGRLAMIAGGSIVTQDVLPFTQVQGDRAKTRGLNLVGIRRHHMIREALEEIKEAYKILFLSGIPIQEALDQLEATNPRPEVKEMIDFIHSSKRGICRSASKEVVEEEI
ncbi:MAG: acyl-ACP--UDP-N-acetylglucosamine O-acyltransferase [Elusimicrobia bacterium]|nr:acyl-ACP--UDP-N-acetylglucosamine O-acyltransferase [Elusimicrobiota bacterium]